MKKILKNGVNKSLKDVLREDGIPPWDRNKILLIYKKEKLIAYGKLFKLFICIDFKWEVTGHHPKTRLSMESIQLTPTTELYPRNNAKIKQS